VTGFVAHSEVSYLCDDTTTDPLYLEGVKGAKSSLTVPLKFEHQTIGTFNVESPVPHAFSEADQLFVETFCRGVAAALNTLDLLSAQRANAAQDATEAIHKAVALPIDEILSDSCALAERFLSAEPEVAARLRRIVWNARSIKEVIHKVGRNMAPTEAVPVDNVSCKRPKLRGRRVLVVDPQDEIRSSAHSLLEPYGCVVETAQKGSEAELLYQLSMNNDKYDVVVTGVDLPDMSGADLLIRLKAMVDPVPIILTQEFGHDPGHTLVRARRNGLNEKAWIIKPFRAPQLLDTMEHILDWSKKDQTQA
jgi:CheY-like chemotaxis protein